MKRKAYFNIKMLHVMFRKIVPNCGYKMWKEIKKNVHCKWNQWKSTKRVHVTAANLCNLIMSLDWIKRKTSYCYLKSIGRVYMVVVQQLSLNSILVMCSDPIKQKQSGVSSFKEESAEMWWWWWWGFKSSNTPERTG